MNLTKVVQLDKDLWAINEMDKITMYLINGANKALLIDTGLGVTNLPDLYNKICGKKPLIVVNTHAHEDHNSGNNQFFRTYVGRFDEAYSHRIMTPEMRELMKQLYFQDIAKEGWMLNTWKPGPSKEVYTLCENDIIHLGNYTFQILEVPSHTLGSIVLWEENHGWMFTGDIMLTWEVWGHLTDGFFAPSASLKIYYKSLKKLLNYSEKIKCIFPSHGVPNQTISKKYTQYKLPTNIIEIYCNGIEKIFDNSLTPKNYQHPVEHGLVVHFPVGGIVFKKDRMH